ncbi:MAG: hypothetical protein ACRCU5_07380 [Rhizobiaceae bacterium]
MRIHSTLQVAAAALMTASLYACASVSPIALAKLAAIDPLSADPAQIAVAARLPQSLKLRTGDLVMVVKTDITEGPGEIDETFYLEVKDAAAGDAGVIMPETNERLQTAEVARQDIERLRATQAKARALRATGDGKGKGSLSVAAKGGCKTADLNDQPLVMNLYMQIETNGEWFPVVNALNLRQALGEEMLAKLPPC